MWFRNARIQGLSFLDESPWGTPTVVIVSSVQFARLNWRWVRPVMLFSNRSNAFKLNPLPANAFEAWPLAAPRADRPNSHPWLRSNSNGCGGRDTGLCNGGVTVRLGHGRPEIYGPECHSVLLPPGDSGFAVAGRNCIHQVVVQTVEVKTVGLRMRRQGG